MRKFMKGCAIAALVLILIGLLLAAIGGTARGNEVISGVVDQVTGGKVQMNLDGIKDLNMTVDDNSLFDMVNQWETTVNYDIEDVTIFDDDHEIFKGDVDMDFSGEEIRELDVEVGGCTFEVKESADGEFHVQAENTKKFQAYVKSDVLYIKATTSTTVNGDNTCNIVLSVPDAAIEKMDLEIGAGVMDLGNIRAEEIDMEVGAGQIKAEKLNADSLIVAVGVGDVNIDKMQVNKLDVEVGLGNLTASGSVAEELLAECAMGNVELEIEGSWEDYDYSIECGMGNVEIGNESYSGVANEKSVDNHAGRWMEVECGMGNVTIEFTE